MGGDLARILPSEMLRFLDPLTEDKAMLDLIEGRMLQYEIRGKQKKGKGPIVICIDSSGSMDGSPEIIIDFGRSISYNILFTSAIASESITASPHSCSDFDFFDFDSNFGSGACINSEVDTSVFLFLCC
jgi:hypothetical protein